MKKVGTHPNLLMEHFSAFTAKSRFVNKLGCVPIFFIFIVLLVLLTSCSPSTNEAKQTYKIGYMICNSKEETMHRFIPMTAYLSEKLGVNFEAVAIDTVDFSKEIEHLDFTHTNSLLYIIMNRNNGLEILAAEKSGSLGARTKGAIVVAKNSTIKGLKDLKGKTMVFGPMLGPTSYLAQLDILLKNGINPESDLAFYSIPPGSFKHEKVIYGVLFGKYDAGAVPMLDFERMTSDGKIEKDDFRVLAEAEAIPYCNFGVAQKVDEGFAKRFKKAVLDIKKEDTVKIGNETIRVLERANIDGYEDVKDSDFNVVREMAKRTNMPPYQKY